MAWIKAEKLVRDGIPAHIERQGGQQENHIAKSTEFAGAIADKIEEEARELANALRRLGVVGDPNAAADAESELGDLEEILKTARYHFQLSTQRINAIRRRKLAALGGFEEWIILERYTNNSA